MRKLLLTIAFLCSQAAIAHACSFAQSTALFTPMKEVFSEELDYDPMNWDALPKPELKHFVVSRGKTRCQGLAMMPGRSSCTYKPGKTLNIRFLNSAPTLGSAKAIPRLTLFSRIIQLSEMFREKPASSSTSGWTRLRLRKNQSISFSKSFS